MKVYRNKNKTYIIADGPKLKVVPDFMLKHELLALDVRESEIEHAIEDLYNQNNDVIHFGSLNQLFIYTSKLKQ